MSLTRPFVELFNELRGTTSQFQRDTGIALRDSSPPRSPELASAIASLHAPWWGFAAWGAAYAMSVMLIVAALFSGVVETVADKIGVGGHEWTTYFWISLVLTAPVSILPLRRWVRRRRRGIVDVARDGSVGSAAIVKATVVTAHSGFSSTAHSTHLTIQADDASTFRGYVPKEPSWVAIGQRVDIVSLPGVSYAILMSPDGSTRPLKR